MPRSKGIERNWPIPKLADGRKSVADVVRAWAKFDQFLPIQAKCRPTSTKLWPTSTKIGRTLAECGPQIGPHWADFSRTCLTSANLGRSLPRSCFAKRWPSLANIGPNLAPNRPTSAESGPNRGSRNNCSKNDGPATIAKHDSAIMVFATTAGTLQVRNCLRPGSSAPSQGGPHKQDAPLQSARR